MSIRKRRRSEERRRLDAKGLYNSGSCRKQNVAGWQRRRGGESKQAWRVVARVAGGNTVIVMMMMVVVREDLRHRTLARAKHQLEFAVLERQHETVWQRSACREERQQQQH
jgi:hypothetical protein